MERNRPRSYLLEAFSRDLQCRLKYCTARSCFSAAPRVWNVPKFRRRPVFGFFFREYSRYPLALSFLIIAPSFHPSHNPNPTLNPEKPKLHPIIRPAQSHLQVPTTRSNAPSILRLMQ